MSTEGNPNILLIIADDLGHDMVRVRGNGANRRLQIANNDGYVGLVGELPTISHILRNGVYFSQAWAHPVCSPTRASIYTGTQPCVHGVGSPRTLGASLDPSSVTTLPNLLAGYRSALFGKWHLGDTTSVPSSTPIDHGWDKHVGTFSGAIGDYSNWTRYDSDDYANPAATTTYATRDVVNQAGNWIASLRRPEFPWFVTLAFNSPHSPFHTPPGGYSLAGLALDNDPRRYNAMVQNLDFNLGRLLGVTPTLPGPNPEITPIHPDQLANTIVIFIGDNGSPDEVNLQEEKETVYEGGVRIPMIIADGQAISNEIAGVAATPRFFSSSKLNATSVNLAHVIDLYRTIADFADPAISAFPADMDSYSLKPICIEAADQRPIRPFNFSQHFHNNGVAVQEATIRNLKYKLNYTTAAGYQLFEYVNRQVPGLEDSSAVDIIAGALDGTDATAQTHLNSLHAELTTTYTADNTGLAFPPL